MKDLQSRLQSLFGTRIKPTYKRIAGPFQTLHDAGLDPQSQGRLELNHAKPFQNPR